jgi:hypothetical protein
LSPLTITRQRVRVRRIGPRQGPASGDLTEHELLERFLLVRVAGTGKKGSAGLGGPPEAAEFNQPHGVSIDATGTLYIVDSLNDRVLKVVRD